MLIYADYAAADATLPMSYAMLPPLLLLHYALFTMLIYFAEDFDSAACHEFSRRVDYFADAESRRYAITSRRHIIIDVDAAITPMPPLPFSFELFQLRHLFSD